MRPGALPALLLLLASAPAFARSPTFAYVTNQGDDTVSVVDIAAGTVAETVRVGAKPAGVAVAAGGRRIYVSNPEGHSVSVIERGGGGGADTHRVVAEVPAGAGPLGLAVSPDGARVFAADWYGDTVAVIDAAGLAVTATLRVGKSPSGLAVDAAGAVQVEAEASVAPDGATGYHTVEVEVR